MPGLVTHEGHACLGGEVNEWLSADAHRRAHDRAAGEAPGRFARVVIGDWFCAVFPGVEALAGDEELAGLRLDAALPYLFLACVEGKGPRGWPGVTFSLEGRGRQDTPPASLPAGDASHSSSETPRPGRRLWPWRFAYERRSPPPRPAVSPTSTPASSSTTQANTSLATSTSATCTSAGP